MPVQEPLHHGACNAAALVAALSKWFQTIWGLVSVKGKLPSQGLSVGMLPCFTLWCPCVPEGPLLRGCLAAHMLGLLAACQQCFVGSYTRACPAAEPLQTFRKPNSSSGHSFFVREVSDVL